MALYRWNEIEKEQLSPTIARQVLHAGNMTVARIYLKGGAVVPRHSHVNEQVSTMESGRLRFVFDDEEVVLGPGETLVIEPNRPHSAEAIEDAVALDLFTPVREDWRSGDDAYLRK